MPVIQSRSPPTAAPEVVKITSSAASDESPIKTTTSTPHCSRDKANANKLHEDCMNPTAVATTYIIILQSVQLCRFEH